MQMFHQVVKADFDAVNQLILRELHSNVPLIEDIGHHIVSAGGKRLRPLVALLSARSCGYSGTGHISLAAVIEFIHTATLLHDDVVDTSDLRRGLHTANAKWGNPPSVLVGDFLYSRAFQMMVAMGDVRVMDILADTTNTISEGEVQQLINVRDATISEADYMAVIDKKTARLFAGAALAGASLAAASATTCDAMRRYGHHLGMAFQLVDDALDYRGDSAQMGKNIGGDLAEGKVTLPLIYAMRTGSAAQKQVICAAIQDSANASLDAIIDIIQATHADDYTMNQARSHRDLARQCVRDLTPSDEQQALLELADFAIERDF